MLILGSTSPRRKEILGYFNIPFTIASPLFEEDDHPFQGNPENYVREIAEGKTLSLTGKLKDNIIICADTTVFLNDRIYLKPTDYMQAFEMLKDFSNKTQTVYTAVAVAKNGQLKSEVEATDVTFNLLTDEQIHAYLKRIHWEDKAGAYTIQGIGSLIVKKINGCYYNVTGLPVNTLHRCLLHFGIDLWKNV